MDNIRHCNKCDANKPIGAFGKDRWQKDGLTIHCKMCRQKRHAEYIKRKPEIQKKITQYYRKGPGRLKQKDSQLKIKYGITLEEYDIMLKLQGNVCMICKGPNQNDRYFAVDHCHLTGKVRGLLCGLCNLGIGYFCDRKELLMEAIKYLEQ